MAPKDGKTRDHPKTHEGLMKAFNNLGITRITPPSVDFTPTGIVSLDLALHGGLAKGKMYLWYGNRDTGKSTSTYLIIRGYLRQKIRVLLIDSERSSTREYFLLMGFTEEDLDYLDIVKVESAEGTWDGIIAALEAKAYGLIVVDSLAKLSPEVELQASVSKANMALQPRLNSLATRIWTNIIADSEATVIFLNQERTDLSGYGTPNISPGGKAIQFDAAVILYMMKADRSQPEEMVFKYKIMRSKVFPWAPQKDPYELHVVNKNGVVEINPGYELFVGAKTMGILKDKSGEAWTKNVAFYGEENLGNGEAQIRSWFEQPSDLRDEIEQAVYTAILSGISPTTMQEESPDVEQDTGFN